MGCAAPASFMLWEKQRSSYDLSDSAGCLRCPSWLALLTHPIPVVAIHLVCVH
jgi:hypothetical protein